ncbi:MAG: M6 family metalloprotease domain-containing protein [Fibrobacteria bacterium]
MVSVRSRFGWAITAACLGLCIRSAQALIVYQGKVVPAWPAEAEAPAAKVSAPAGQAAASPSASAVSAAAAAPHYYPHPSGAVWGLTLLVDFSDQSPAFTKEEINDWLNLKGFNRFSNQGSVRDYYAEASNGKVDFQNEVHGFYRAKNTKAYYEGGNGYQRAEELVAEILEHFDAEVDFSKFDNDKDGKVEAVSLVYAGSGVTFAQGLWPHAGSLNQKRDGVQLTRYMMTDLGKTFGLYVFCHECGHMLFGWPDLYGFGDYCLMGNRPNDINPVMINDFYRADQGWIGAVDIDKNTNAHYRARANDTLGYRFVNPARPQECFFWSNLKNQGRRAVLKGRGLMVLHFDKDIGANNPPKPLGLAVVQADGKRQLDTAQWPSPGSDALDYFSASNGAKFGATTVPAANWNNGTASGLNLYDIGSALDSMDFYVGTGAVAVQAPRPTRLPSAAFEAGREPSPGISVGADGARIRPARIGAKRAVRAVFPESRPPEGRLP